MPSTPNCRLWFQVEIGVGANKTKHHWQDEQSVEQSKKHNQEEDFEESQEDDWFWGAEKDKGEKSRNAPIEDGRTNVD